MSDQVSPILWLIFIVVLGMSIVSTFLTLYFGESLFINFPVYILTVGFFGIYLYQKWYYKNKIMPKRVERLEETGDE